MLVAVPIILVPEMVLSLGLSPGSRGHRKPGEALQRPRCLAEPDLPYRR